MSPVTYRLATPEEELVFFRRLFDVARRPEFALAGLQGEELDGLLDSQYNARTVHYKGTYPTAEYRLVLFEGELVGGMIVEDRETDLNLIDITIL